VIHRCAQRIDIGAEVDVHVAADLLGADVIRRAVRLAGFGFGGGLALKRALLDFESVVVGRPRDLFASA